MTTMPASEELKDGDFMKVLTKEFSLFEIINRRPPHLQQLFDALSTAQATYVEAERAFPLCAESIDALCFLKAHFHKKKKRRTG